MTLDDLPGLGDAFAARRIAGERAALPGYFNRWTYWRATTFVGARRKTSWNWPSASLQTATRPLVSRYRG